MRRVARVVSFASVVVPLVVAQLFFAPSARADDAVCVDASEHALELRRTGKLRESLKQLAICADPSCPREVSEECTHRARAIDTAIPTLVIAASDGTGNDLTAARLTIDGSLVSETLEGRAIALDPGAHTVKVEGNGAVSEKTFVLREGEKDRHESFVLGSAPVAPLPPPPPVPEQPSFGTQKKLALVAGGVGLVGIALGTTFGLVASGKQSSERRECSAASCTNRAGALADYGSAGDFATASTISWIAAAAFVTTGVVLYLTAPRAATTSVGALARPSLSF